MTKCEFCENEGVRFRVVDKITYWMCKDHHFKTAYGDLVYYHNNKALKEAQVTIISKRRKKIRRASVPLIKH